MEVSHHCWVASGLKDRKEHKYKSGGIERLSATEEGKRERRNKRERGFF